MGAKDLVATTLRRTLEARGYQVSKADFRNDSDIRRKLLLDRLGVTTVLDVGASDGMYGDWLRSAGYAGQIRSFEPLAEPFAVLDRKATSDAGWDANNFALGAESATTEINVSSRDTWSSLLPMDSRADAPELSFTRTEVVQVARLDDLHSPDGGVTWLKLDVQGFELQTLAGAEKTLAACTAVECELSLEPLYEGQPSARELIDYLDDRGFLLVGATNGRVREQTGRAVWIDGIFSRE